MSHDPEGSCDTNGHCLPSPDEGRQILPKIWKLFHYNLTLCAECVTRNLPRCCSILIVTCKCNKKPQMHDRHVMHMTCIYPAYQAWYGIQFLITQHNRHKAVLICLKQSSYTCVLSTWSELAVSHWHSNFGYILHNVAQFTIHILTYLINHQIPSLPPTNPARCTLKWGLSIPEQLPLVTTHAG